MRISDWSSDVCSSDLMRALLDDDSSDAVPALHCPVAVADPTEAAAAVVEAVREQDGVRQKPVFTAWVGEHAVVEGRRLFDRSGLPHYATPDRKSVGEGKSVSVRVDLGGCRFPKKKKKIK